MESHVDPRTLSEATGHATVAFTLDVYGHSNPDMRQQAADQLEELICQYERIPSQIKKIVKKQLPEGYQTLIRQLLKTQQWY